jgi:NADPH2:quinone reductase
MQAVVMTGVGSPEVLQLQTVPTPEIRTEQEIRVRLKAAGLNPIDTKLRSRGTFYPESMPAILGCDGAGVVEAVGAAVERFQVGDAVYFCNGGLGCHPGTYAEYAVVDERFVAAKPQTLTFAEAAAVPLVAITAWEALYDRAKVQAAQKVLIHAGAGGVGHIAIQLARLQGATVCTTVSNEIKAEFARQLGANKTILYREQDFRAEVLAWTYGKGVDVALDTVGGTLLSATFPAVRIYGDVVTLLAPAPDTDWKTARTRNLRISFELMLTPLLQELTDAQKHHAEILTQCGHWLETGKLKISLQKTFPLAEAAAAHRLLELGSTSGKIALVIEE